METQTLFSTAGLHYSEMKIQDRAPPVELSGTEVNWADLRH